MRALRNRLLLLIVATGLVLGVLPAVASAITAPLPAQAVGEQSITMQLSKDSIKVGAMVDVTGTVTNAPRGTVVRVQRQAGDTWVTVGTTRTSSAAGAFQLKNVVASVKGAFLYRAVAEPDTTLTSGYSWLIVTAKNPPTIVSGLVQAGGPVAGSTVKIFVPGRAKPVQTAVTTRYGYFLARLPGLPKSLRVEATGGQGPIGRFKGTMIGITANPTTDDNLYVNPVSTLVATYRDTHPRATRATALAKVLGLLGLENYHDIDSALGVRPSYFDSVSFLRTAKRNGGFDAYIARLIKRIDHGSAPVTFRHTGAKRAGSQGAAIAGLIGEGASGYLGVAAQGASIINAGMGLMNLVGSLVGWSPSGGPTPGQIMSAIDQVQTTLGVIEKQIADLTVDLQNDFDALKLDIDQTAYDQAMNESVRPMYKLVNAAKEAYKQYVLDQDIIAMCVPAPADPSEPLVAPAGDCAQPAPLQAITNDQVGSAISGVTGDDLTNFKTASINLANDLAVDENGTDDFFTALRPAEGMVPAIVLLSDVAIDKAGELFLPASSAAMQDFADTVLTNQSLGYYLAMAYETSVHGTTSSTGHDISVAFLGEDYADYITANPYQPKENSLDRPIPADGNLHEEMTYLQGILPVPEWMAVDTNADGQMYMTSSNLGLGSTYLPSAAASRARCVEVKDFASGYRDYPVSAGGSAPNGGKDSVVCTALADPLIALGDDMVTYPAEQGALWAADVTQGESASTYASGLGEGWGPVFLGELGTMLPRLAAVNSVSAQYYFDPGAAVWFPSDDGISGEHGYWVATPSYVQCSDPPGLYPYCSDSNQTYVSPVIDWMKLYFKTLSGSDASCTWAVGMANSNTDECFDMPILLSRPIPSGEDYLP